MGVHWDTTMNLPALHLPGCPHEPTIKQWIGLSFPNKREMLYGGAAGGGKTDWLLMGALQCIDTPGYAAVIFRRTFKELASPDGLMMRADEWLGEHPHFEGAEMINGVHSRWKYKGGGMLVFSHMEHEKNKRDHKGAAYQYVGFDELTDFSESQYLYLMSRLRRPEGFLWPVRMRAASNPGGPGHDWVRERFPIPHEGVERHMPDKLFLSARLQDNPYLDRADYELQLMELHPYERAQLLEGNWDARPPGGLFKREWFDVVDTAPPPSASRLRYWDLAATQDAPGKDPDWTVGTLWDEHDGEYYVIDVVRFRDDPGEVDRMMKATAMADGSGVTQWVEREGGASGKIAERAIRKNLIGHSVDFESPTGDKVVRAGPMASAAKGGLVKLVAGPWIPHWFTELEMFPSKGVHDDQVDSADGGFGKIALPVGSTWAGLYGKRAAEIAAERAAKEANGGVSA